MPVTVVQAPAAVVGTATYLEVTLTDVAANNLIVASIQCQSSANRTFTGSDDRSNSYTEALAATDPSGDGSIAYAVAATSGTTIVRMTASASTGLFMAAFEVSGCSATTPLDQTAQFVESSASGTHYCAPSGGIDTAEETFIVCHARLQAAATACQAGSGYTEHYTTSQRLIQYRVTSAPLSGERGQWSSTGTARIGEGFMASFKADPSGPSSGPWLIRRPVRRLPAR